jgi:hypothetical protein
LYTLALTTDLLRESPALLVSHEAPGFADLIASGVSPAALQKKWGRVIMRFKRIIPPPPFS